jgi:CRP-like cAMP-binding protein
MSKVRNHPVSSKYARVWQRAKVKIKTRLLLKYMMEDRILFGANIVSDEETDEKAIVAQIMKNKIEAAQNQVVVYPSRTYLMSPRNVLRVLWNIIYTIAVLEVGLVRPFRLAFLESDIDLSWLYFDSVVDFLFLIDIFFNLNSTYTNEEGVEVRNRHSIAKRYLKSWLLPDIVSCLPMILTHQANYDLGASYHMTPGRLPRLYRLVKILRVMKMIASMQKMESIEYLQTKLSLKTSTIKIIVFLCAATLLLHNISCIWFLMARLEDSPETWLASTGTVDTSISDQYITSLYWAILTLATVGYGDIHAETTFERMLAACWMAFSMLFLSFAVSSVSSLLQETHSKDQLLTTRLAAIDEFSHEAKLDRKLTERLRHAVKYSVSQQGYSNKMKHSLYAELPKELKYEVAMAMHRGAGKSVPFFREKDRAFTVAIVPFLNHMFARMLTNIYKEKDYADEIYFIVKGGCYCMVTETNAIRKLQRGAYFGEIEVMKKIPRKFTVTANVDSELLTMNKSLLSKIRRDFTAVYRDMEQVATARDQLNEKAKAQVLRLIRRAQAQASKSEDEESNSSGLSGTPSEVSSPKMIVRRGSLRLEIPIVSKPFDSFESFAQLNKRIKLLEDVVLGIQRTVESVTEALHREASIKPETE